MKRKDQYIAAIIAEAKAPCPPLPWTRGARRAAFCLKRKQVENQQAA